MKEEKSFCLKALFLALMKIWKEKQTCTLKKYKHQQNALLCTCESILSFFICYVLLWDIIVFTQKYALGNYYVNESLSMGQSSTCLCYNLYFMFYFSCDILFVYVCKWFKSTTLFVCLTMTRMFWNEIIQHKVDMDLLWRLTYLLSLFLFSVVW